ncbi:ribonuclease III domain-containing protein, partial [Stieleria sp.]|uniref:ribonuclease III domain-containing protein n=1 Tax=Stieleria sp. TaxID=2795976 RepID=UPI00356952D6
MSLPLDSESDDAELAPAGSLTDHLHCSDDHDDSFEKDPDDLDQERSKPVIDFDPPGTGDDVRLVASPRDESGDLDHSEKLIRCQQLIDYQFKDQELLRFALTHASGASHRLASNERLEFLGDSILGFVICSWLYEEYPEYNEGDLTKIKSAVVSRRT